jgi:diguanylate cyclase (GGDEF)-like protein/PAS domain S-box-containing protein
MKRDSAVRLRVLLLEDNPADAELVLYELQRGGIEAETVRVITREEFEKQLEARPDAILSDYQLPLWTGLDALLLVRAYGLDTPFIIVSGTIGEDLAVEAMRHGADDYLLKDRLSRLGVALEQALERKRLRDEARNTAEALRESEAGLHRAQVMAKIAHVITGPDGAFQTWSETLPKLIGVDPARMPSNTREWLDLVHPEDRALFRTKAIEAGMENTRTDVEYRLRGADGEWISVGQVMEPFASTAEMPGRARWFNTLQDVTERRQSENRIRRLNRVYAVLSGINGLIVRVRDRDELYREACRIAVDAGEFPVAWIGVVDRNSMRINPVASAGSKLEHMTFISEQFSLAEDSPMGNTLTARAVREKKVFFSNDAQNDPAVRFKQEHVDRGTHSMVILPLLVSGEAVGALVLYAEEAGFFDEAELKLLVELASDISFAIDHIEKSEKVDYLAYYDVLTGLANRTLFHERLTQQLHRVERAEGGRQGLAVFLLDVERFKSINDSLGRQAGDQLLKQIAERLRRHAPDSAQIARVGVDRFKVAIPDIKQENDVGRFIEQCVLECFGAPFTIGDASVRVRAKVGVAMYPNDGADAETLVRNAEAALDRAKSTGSPYLFFAEEMTERVAGKLALEQQLQHALENDEFVLHYQPKVDLESRRIVGVEALIRWMSPERGLVPPGHFIPLLEETGLILEVGAWALRRAVRDHRDWLSQGLLAPRVAVNVSQMQLRHRDFVEVVRETLQQGAKPSGIDLEITESMVMHDIEGNVAKLKAIRDLGVSIAIDDFGTGYSSLGYLAKLPVQALKIDRSFIVSMASDPDAMTLISTIISLAHSLRLHVIAEGVETEEQARMLRLLRCDQIQGYLIARPQPLEQLTALLQAQK